MREAGGALAARRWLLLCAAVGGAAIAASFLQFSLWPLAWVAFVPILVAVTRAGAPRRAALVGLVAGLATNVPAFHWLIGTIHRFGGFSLWLSVFFYGALSLYSAAEFVLFALGLSRIGLGPLAIHPALLWVSLEFLYPNLFPWRMANTQFPVPELIQIGEITGPYGLSFAMLWVSSAAALAIEGGARRAAAAFASSAIASLVILGFGVLRLPAIERAMAEAVPVRIGIVQGNLSIEEKGDVRYFESNLATYRELSRDLFSHADVVIWPESVIGDPLPRNLVRLPSNATAILGLRGPLLAGALTYAGSPEAPIFYNSVILLDGEGRLLGMSDKQILMPFGEYLPLASLFPSVKRLSPMTGDFAAGAAVIPLDVPGAGRFAPLNCYEDLIAPIARRAVREGGAELLFSVANDAWFGDTAAPYQHEALALWRAVESRRYLVRVTNTGVTDVIDAAGRVRQRLPVFRPAAALAGVKRLGVETFYLRCGDVFAWLVACAALVVTARGRSTGC